MKSLLSIIIAALLGGLPTLASASPPGPPPGAPPWEQPPPETQRLRELRLREAVLRGEISEEEAHRLRRFYKRHDAMRLPPGRRHLASQPAGESPPPKAWQRWRKKQDTLYAPHRDGEE